MLFADTDVDKMRMTLSRSRDSLKVSSAMFRWTLGDARADASMGIGYAGLIAALERLNPSKAASLPPLHPAPTSDLPPTPPSKASQHTESHHTSTHRLDGPSLQELRPDDIHSYSSEVLRATANHSHLREDDMGLSSNLVDLHKNWRAPPSARSSESTRDTMYQQNIRYHEDPVYEDVSAESIRLRALEDKLHNMGVHERYLDENSHSSKVDSPIASPYWAPRQSGGSKMVGGKAALVTAVEQKKHRILEQLLDSGAKADPPTEAAMLRTAAQNRDAETIALLLRYGADANGFDREGITPLFAATQAQCLESAKILLKRGADPNLSAGPESETPLSLASSNDHIDLVQLYLANGGNPDFIMENGSTALISSINKVASPKVVELLLSSGGDANAKNGEGTTALFQAIQSNRVDLMTVLLDHGANPNLPGPKHPLWPSTYKPKALQLLLSRGADHKKTPGLMELASSCK